MVKTILIVDDSAEVRNLVVEILRREGHEVLQTGRAAEALEMIRERRVDLMVLDVGMPQMDGLTMLRRMREMPMGRTVPVILLTAQDEQAMMAEAASLGICDYLLKTTFSLKVLVARVRRQLEPAEVTRM